MVAWTSGPGSTLAKDDGVAPLFLIDVSDVSDGDGVITIAVAIAYGPGNAMLIKSISFSAKTVAHLALEGVLVAAMD